MTNDWTQVMDLYAEEKRMMLAFAVEGKVGYVMRNHLFMVVNESFFKVEENFEDVN